MDINKTITAIIALVLFIAGCKREKDDLTLPVKIHLKIGISEGAYIGDFGECKIGIQKILFEGKREAGGDVFFETDPKFNLPVLEFGANPEIIADFDIPQGIYDYMKWSINLRRIVTYESINGNDTVPLSIGILINGYHSFWDMYYENMIIVPFIFAVDDTERFSVRSSDPNGSSTIVLSASKDYEATLWFNLPYVFGPVFWPSLEMTINPNDSLPKMIMISSNNNKGLYWSVLQRLANSAIVTVK